MYLDTTSAGLHVEPQQFSFVCMAPQKILKCLNMLHMHLTRHWYVNENVCCHSSLLQMLLRPNMQLHQADAADYLMRVASEVQQGSTKPLDMVFVDAFDGNDDVPASLCNSGDREQALFSSSCNC